MSLPHRLLSFSRSALLVGAGLGLFSLPAAHATFNLTTIHTFDPANDGNVPYAALVQGADGKFYGVNSTGGRSNNGTVFSLNVNGGAFTALNTFTGASQGKMPEGGLVQARDGNFYGTTNTGGGGAYGTLYQVIPTTGKLAVLANFTNGDPGGNPVGALVEGIDGLLYGTAQYGGADNDGTIFRAVPPSGGAITLATITGGLAGTYPQSDLIQALDGNFYGTTAQGGTNSLGTFFRVTPAGALTTLYSFTGGTDGSRPLRGVVQGPDGAFYGVSNQGGAYGVGALFRLVASATTATVTPLYNFVPLLDGSNALGNLTLASDGNFYGTTAAGGANGNGTIYRVTPTGGYTLLYSFANGADGGFPVGGLTQGSDGRLYGTTAGQNGSAGTVFAVNAGLSSPAPQPTFLLQTSAKTGDTILIKGDHFVGTTGVTFVGADNAAVAAASFTVLSKTVLQVVVPTGAQTGALTVTANARTGTTPVALTVAMVAPPVVVPTISVLAPVATASKADGSVGKFKVTRAGGDNTAALTVGFKIAPASTAVLGTDYVLVCKGAALGTSGSVTIPAGKSGVGVKVVPVQSTTPAPATTVFLKVKKGTGYTLGSPVRAVVQVTANGAGQ